MSKISFENYGILASRNLSFTEMAGRHDFQRISERNIATDVIRKLELDSTDDLLEIGCGTGNVLIPLSFVVNSATGIDGPTVIEKLDSRLPEGAIRTVVGDFLEIEFDETFSKILICYLVTFAKI